MNRIFICLTVCVLAATSCKKQDLPVYNQQVRGALTIEFDNIAGSANLQLHTGNYMNAAGETFKVTKLKYFTSNFVLTRADGSVYAIPQDSSYFLIDESVAASRLVKLSVPEGEYTTLSFVLGVDSLRNTMDIARRTGALDPTNTAADMYWSWNSGYIFFKLEGTSPAASTAGNVFQCHIGGFGGYSTPTVNNLQTVTIHLTSRGVARVKSGRTANIHLLADILKALNGSTQISFATSPMIHSAAAGQKIANNYRTMFSHDHTEH